MASPPKARGRCQASLPSHRSTDWLACSVVRGVSEPAMSTVPVMKFVCPSPEPFSGKNEKLLLDEKRADGRIRRHAPCHRRKEKRQEKTLSRCGILRKKIEGRLKVFRRPFTIRHSRPVYIDTAYLSARHFRPTCARTENVSKINEPVITPSRSNQPVCRFTEMAGNKKPSENRGFLKLVAGAGFEPTTFGL